MTWESNQIAEQVERNSLPLPISGRILPASVSRVWRRGSISGRSKDVDLSSEVQQKVCHSHIGPESDPVHVTSR